MLVGGRQGCGRFGSILADEQARAVVGMEELMAAKELDGRHGGGSGGLAHGMHPRGRRSGKMAIG